MATARRSVRLAAPADEVWAFIGPFDSLDRWHPAVAACELERDSDRGEVRRRITLKDGGVILNRLEARDDTERFYRYTIVDAPYPVGDYTSTLRVRPEGEGACVVEWTAEFAPANTPEADAVALIESVFDDGLTTLARLFTPAHGAGGMPAPEPLD